MASEAGAAQPPRTTRAAWLALLVLCVAALALRTARLGYLLPHDPEPDAYIVHQAHMIESDDPAAQSSRIWGKYPHLLARMLLLFPDPPPAPDAATAPLEEHLAYASLPMVRGRILVALLAGLGVPATFLLARRFLGGWGALLAAALLATSLLHLCFSQQARPHGPLSTFTALAIVGTLAFARSGTFAAWCGASALCALALACLHSGVATFLSLGAAFLLVHGRAWARKLPWLLVPAGLGAAVFALFYPFLFADRGASDLDVRRDAVVQAGHDVRLEWFDGGGFEVVWHALVDYDPVLLALAAVGAAVALVARSRGRVRGASRELAVCLAFVLPYLLAIGLFNKSFERFVLPLHPFLACLAAVGPLALCRALAPRARAAAAILVAALCLAFPAWIAARVLALHGEPDTQERLAGWLEHRFGARRSALALLVDMRLSLPLFALTRDNPYETQYERMYLMPWQEYVDERRFARPETWRVVEMAARDIIAGNAAYRFPGDTLEERLVNALRQEALAAHGDLAFVHGPEERGSVSPLAVALKPIADHMLRMTAMRDSSDPTMCDPYGRPGMLARVLGAQSWGPSVDVFRMPP